MACTRQRGISHCRPSRAVIGIVSGSATLYLAQSVIVSGVSGLIFVVSVVMRRPLAGTFGLEVYPFTPEVRSSATFHRVFGRISLAWGAYLLLRSGARLALLASGDVELFLLVTAATVPVTVVLMSWSLWYGVRGFRRSSEWGHVLFPAPVALNPH